MLFILCNIITFIERYKFKIYIFELSQAYHPNLHLLKVLLFEKNTTMVLQNLITLSIIEKSKTSVNIVIEYKLSN